MLIFLGLLLAGCAHSEGGRASASAEHRVRVDDAPAADASLTEESNAPVVVPEQKATGELAWSTDVDAALARSSEDGKPVLVFFCAQWAMACKAFDQETFADPTVRKELSDGYHLVRIDATNDEDPGVAEVLGRFSVLGLPTLLVLSARGEEKLRLHEFMAPAELLPKIGGIR